MNTIEHPISVRMANNRQERTRVFRSRYEIYVEEMGLKNKYANHKWRLIEDPLDRSGMLWIASMNQEIVGSLRGNIGFPSDLGIYKDLYGLDSPGEHSLPVAVLSNFVIHRAHRNLRVAMALVRTAYAEGLRAGVRIAFLDCEAEMVRFYIWMGCEVHRPVVTHPEYGPGVCMKMELRKWTQRFSTPNLSAAAA
jgi:hypothetical protein